MFIQLCAILKVHFVEEEEARVCVDKRVVIIFYCLRVLLLFPVVLNEQSKGELRGEGGAGFTPSTLFRHTIPPF